MHVWEGGPAIGLDKAQQNTDYLLRMVRAEGYEGWIDGTKHTYDYKSMKFDAPVKRQFATTDF